MKTQKKTAPQGQKKKSPQGQKKSAPKGKKTGSPGKKPGPQGKKPGPQGKTFGGKRPFNRKKVNPADNVFNMRVEQIKIRLDELRQYKRILAEEGLEPDQDDKRVETELIRRLLWLEKQQDPETLRKKAKAEEDAATAPPPVAPKTRRGKDRKR